MTPEQWEYREASEALERSEKRRYAERKHKREVRAIVTGTGMVCATLLLLVMMCAKGCEAGAQRAHETEMACIAHGGSWVGGDSTGGDPATCTHGKDDK